MRNTSIISISLPPPLPTSRVHLFSCLCGWLHHTTPAALCVLCSVSSLCSIAGLREPLRCCHFALCMLHSLISLLLCVPCSMSVCANHLFTFSSLADLRLCYDAFELLYYCQQHFPFLLCLHHVAVSLISYICDACATQFCLKAMISACLMSFLMYGYV